jgi:hypothetical protein
MELITEVGKATATVADLEFKLADASARAVSLQVERKRHAYDANTGRAAAKKSLEAANSASAKIGFEIENLRHAIEEAKRRLVESQRNEEMAGLRGNALQVMSLADEAGERGTVIDDLTKELCRELQEMFADARRFARLGAPAANERSLKLALTRRILAELRDANLDIEMIAPGNRHPASELVSNFATAATGWAAAVLGENKAEAA